MGCDAIVHEEKHLLPGVVVRQRRVQKPTVFYQKSGITHERCATYSHSIDAGRSC
jgi:hypothetical protein